MYVIVITYYLILNLIFSCFFGHAFLGVFSLCFSLVSYILAVGSKMIWTIFDHFQAHCDLFTCDQQLHFLLVTPLYLRIYLWPVASLLTCDPFVLETLLVTSSFTSYLWPLWYLRPYLWPAASLLRCDPFVLETQCQSIVYLWSQ